MILKIVNKFFLSKDLDRKIIEYLKPVNRNEESQQKEIEKNLEKLSEFQDLDESKILLISLYKMKKRYLENNFKESKKESFFVRKEILGNEYFSEESKNLILFLAEMYTIKCEISEWVLSAELDYKNFYDEFFQITKDTLDLKKDIDKSLEKVSESAERILLNEKYLIKIMKLNELSNKKNKGLVVSDKNKEIGNQILSKLNFFEQKVKSYHVDNNILNYNIVLDKIKLEFYLGYSANLIFKKMVNFCSLCVNSAIEDPVYSALENFRENNSYEKSFKDYLYSYKINIYKDENKKVIFRISQFNNLIATEEDRIIIHKVKDINEIKDI